MKRHIYLEDIPLDEARAALTAVLQSHNLWQPLGMETIPVTAANGRITAAAVWAKISSPHYHASAMDGYAVRAQDTHGAMETHPLRLPLVEGVAQPVNTGHALPAWANAVIMIEHT